MVVQDIYLPYNMSSCRLDDVRVGPFTGCITTDKHFIKLFIMCIHLLPLCRNSPQSQMFGATVFCCGRPSLMDVNLTPRWYVAICFFFCIFVLSSCLSCFPPIFQEHSIHLLSTVVQIKQSLISLSMCVYINCVTRHRHVNYNKTCIQTIVEAYLF